MVTEVFNRIGEEEMHSENPNFFKRQRDDGDEFETSSKIESISKPISEAKREFFEHLDNDSLTVDTCCKLSHDWKKK